MKRASDFFRGQIRGAMKVEGKFQRVLVRLLMLVVGAIGLKDVKIKVPPMVRSGDSALLTCSYELENNVPLETIKWYFGEGEFYRYSPADTPPWVSYNVSNIKVDDTRSNTQDVTLLNVTRGLSGTYKCEVSEGPDRYETKILGAVMTVVDVPESEPSIEVEKRRLAAGETLRANCTSGASRPAPNITWTLNGLHLDNRNVEYKVQYRNTAASGDRNKTRSDFQLKITNDLFQNGKLRIRCFASIGYVYHASATLDIIEDAPLLASITGDASAQNDITNGGNVLGFPHPMSQMITSLAITFLNYFFAVLMQR